MSIVDRISEAVGLSTPVKSPASVAVIEQKITAVQARIETLQRDHALACLRWADDGDAAARDKISQELEAARIDLASLRSALAMSHERNSQEDRRRLAALNATRLQSMIVHMRGAEKAAAELVAAIEKASEARRKLLDKSAKARASAPSPLPIGSQTEPGAIDKLIANELYRTSHEPNTPKRAGTGHLPGAVAPTIKTWDDPASIVPLLEQLRQAHEYAIATVRGEIAIDRMPNVEGPTVAEASQPVEAIEAEAIEPVIAEPAEFNPEDLLPGTHSVAELMNHTPRKLT